MNEVELRGTSIIAGKYTEGGGKSFTAFNPVKKRTLAPSFYEASVRELSWAVAAAAEAFPVYSRVTGKDRAAFLECIAGQLEKNKADLVSRCMEETGLTEPRLEGELGRTTGQIRMFAELIREGSWADARIDTNVADIRSMLIPLGPVAVFGASNFPLAFSTAGGDTASALAAGCPVVFKGHPDHPGTCEIAGEAISRALKITGMPEGVFSLLQGKEHQLGIDLVGRREIKAVGFTGSLKAGRALFNAAAGREEPIPVYAEMGSLNPVILLPRALSKRGDKIAEGLAGSLSLGTGQFCTNPGLVILVGKDSLDGFRNLLSEKLSSLSPGIMLSRKAISSYIKGVEAVSSLEGVEVEWAGNGPGSGEEMTGYGCVITATPEAFLCSPPLQKEIFGPATVLVQVGDEKELISALMKTGGQLTVTFHHEGDDLKQFSGLVEAAEQIAGRIIFNGFPTGVEVCHAMHHGGPYPASTDLRSTSVGTRGISRFARPVCFQNAPEAVLPKELWDDNPLGIRRLVNGVWVEL